jgi:hypothetical protein
VWRAESVRDSLSEEGEPLMFGREKSTRADGAKVTESKNKKVVKYPGGDLEIHDKKRGKTTSFSKIRPDGKRERDGR